MDAITWNKIIASFQNSHIMQTWQWSEVKGNYGWKPYYKIWGEKGRPDAASLILERTIPNSKYFPNFRVLYCPKGPLLRDWKNHELVGKVFGDLAEFTRTRGAIFLKTDSDITVGYGIPGDENASECENSQNIKKILKEKKWCYSPEQIQYKNTVLINIDQSEDDLLANMKQKTRYNIRLALKKGITIREGLQQDYDLLYRMYAETSLRDSFAIRERDYYYTIWEKFSNNKNIKTTQYETPHCIPLIAELDNTPLAAVVLFSFAGVAYYLQGMSLPIHRKLMPNYLLQWRAMIKARSGGCSVYDLWGAPDEFTKSDPMWGVFRFKQGFGGYVHLTLGAYDFPARPILYELYMNNLPKLLDITRRVGIRRTRTVTRKY
jgi:lipid II:glycine glycyltransferase (peptidoglycan interpeptide bridge formation enzyme)